MVAYIPGNAVAEVGELPLPRGVETVVFCPQVSTRCSTDGLLFVSDHGVGGRGYIRDMTFPAAGELYAYDWPLFYQDIRWNVAQRVHGLTWRAWATTDRHQRWRRVAAAAGVAVSPRCSHKGRLWAYACGWCAPCSPDSVTSHFGAAGIGAGVAAGQHIVAWPSTAFFAAAAKHAAEVAATRARFAVVGAVVLMQKDHCIRRCLQLNSVNFVFLAAGGYIL